MTIGTVNFTDEGYKKFKTLTKDEQVSYLKKRMPLTPNVEDLLSYIPYAKRKKSTKQAKKSTKENDTTEDS